MKKTLFLLLLFLLSSAVYSTTWIITNSGYTFTPASVTITFGDDVNFTLESIHNAVEVTKATWDVDGNTALPGGFQTLIGGGLVPSSQLAVGTHYYVCSPHASLGMKGVIIVQGITGIEKNKFQPDFSIYPNPSNNLITIKASNNLTGSKYFITDQTGRQVFDGKLVGEATLVDVSQLSPGIYIIQIIGNRKQSFKIIKK
jgi:plastocyanin